MAKREFAVKKAFKFNGRSYAVRERIVLTGPVSEQAEARIGFGLKWRFIVQIIDGKVATLKDENAGKKNQDGVMERKEPAAPQKDATKESEQQAAKEPEAKTAPAAKKEKEPAPKQVHKGGKGK